MTNKSDKCEQARTELIQQALDEICKTQSFSDFYSRTYYVLAKLWLHVKAEKENLFKTGDWDNAECRDELIERVKAFLVKYIR